MLATILVKKKQTKNQKAYHQCTEDLIKYFYILFFIQKSPK